MNTSFDRSKGNDEWLTPPYIITALGEFDLDPCAPINTPVCTAPNTYTVQDNGLIKEWKGRVFCNPPYGNQTAKWLEKCSTHKNCIALTFARTETRMFFDYVWNKAYGLFFIKGRVSFYTIAGTKGGPAGAPSVLIAYDEYNSNILKNITNIIGKYIKLQ